jgi:Leucine-rich repeat (LRR) protein
MSLGKNQIKDIKVLEKVTKLSVLDLRDNQVEDIGPLAKQTELKLLMIERNKIKDLKPLVDAAKTDSEGPKRFAPYLRLYVAGNPLAEATKAKQLETLKAAGVRIEG